MKNFSTWDKNSVSKFTPFDSKRSSPYKDLPNISQNLIKRVHTQHKKTYKEGNQASR